MKSARRLMAVLCPETDGLQAKHRIKRTLKGETREERVEEMLSILEKEVNFNQTGLSKMVARIISLVYEFNPFTSAEVYQILKNEYFKSFR